MARPRATLDIDILIEADTLDDHERCGRFGLCVSCSADGVSNGNVKIHRLTKIDESVHETLDLDLLMVTPGNIKAWRVAEEVTWAEGVLKVVSPEGLIY